MSAPQLDITWDVTKAESNLTKHGVNFAQAATVLLDPLAVTVFDATHSQHEERWFTLGSASDGALLAVAPTRPLTSTEFRYGSFPHAQPLAPNVSSTRPNRDNVHGEHHESERTIR